MLKIQKNRLVWREIKIYLPIDSDQDEQVALIQVQFKIQPKSVKKKRQKQASEMLQQIQQLAKGGDIKSIELDESLDHDRQLEYLHEDIRNIKGIEDEDGNSEFSKEMLETILDQTYIRTPIAEEWLKVQNDEVWRKEKEKN